MKLLFLLIFFIFLCSLCSIELKMFQILAPVHTPDFINYCPILFVFAFLFVFYSIIIYKYFHNFSSRPVQLYLFFQIYLIFLICWCVLSELAYLNTSYLFILICFPLYTAFEILVLLKFKLIYISDYAAEFCHEDYILQFWSD